MENEIRLLEEAKRKLEIAFRLKNLNEIDKKKRKLREIETYLEQKDSKYNNDNNTKRK